MRLVGILACGCAGLDAGAPPFEALLVQKQVEGGCQLERVTPGQPEPHGLGVVPGACAFSQVVLVPDGSRLLLGRFPMAFEVDLASGEVRTLPKPDASSHPALPDPQLHLDGQGTVLWEIVEGEGSAEYDSEGWPAWPAWRYELHALREGAWVVEAEAVEPEGSPPSEARQRFEARFASEVVVRQSVPYLKGEMAGPELRAVLDGVSGIQPLKWHVDGLVAQPFTSGGLGFPVLLRVGERWQVLPEREGAVSEAQVGHQWLLVRHGRKKAHAYSLATGERVWSGPAPVALWPVQVTGPISAP
jgi:hypothetical protein